MSCAICRDSNHSEKTGYGVNYEVEELAYDLMTKFVDLKRLQLEVEDAKG